MIVLAWIWLLLGAGIEMDEMDMGGGEIMLMTPPWTPGYAMLIFLMWTIMMMAMMLPSAAPAILLVAALGRERGVGDGAPTAGLFTLGYVLVWIGFSLAATFLQWGLDQAGILSGAMAVGSAVAVGVRARRRRYLPVDTFEAGLPASLPFATGIPAAPLAQRHLGSRWRAACVTGSSASAAVGC